MRYDTNHKILIPLGVALLLSLLLARPASAEPINYRALFDAIAQVESNQGATSANRYQLSYAFVYDIERITGENLDYATVTKSKTLSEQYMRVYWSYYTSRQFNKTGESVTPALLAKLHHVGYKGLKTKPTAAATYWRKVYKWYNKFNVTPTRKPPRKKK